MKVQYGNSQNLGGMAPAGQPAGMGGGMPSQANPAAMGRNPMAAGAMSPLMARPGSGFLPPPDGAQMPAPPVSTNVGGLQTGGLDPMPRPIPGPMPQTTMGAAGAAPNMLMQAAQSGALRGR